VTFTDVAKGAHDIAPHVYLHFNINVHNELNFIAVYAITPAGLHLYYSYLEIILSLYPITASTNKLKLSI
jgi:hypothetical protein